jgi:N-acetyltransferase
MNVVPVTLNGSFVYLRPLAIDDVAALAQVGLDADLWRLQLHRISSEGDMRAYVRAAIDEAASGTALPFVIADQETDRVIGSTRYADIVKAHRRLEIGWTWITPRYQGTAANTEAKFLLLSHAFESLGAMRVTFKTDALNVRSRMAILSLGATEEGTFRRHMICDDGRVRDSVYFSITDLDWPRIKARLQSKLARFGGMLVR